MVEFQNELMMAVIVASTALAGLAGVVVAQIRQSTMKHTFRRGLVWAIVVSFFIALVAVLMAIAWFTEGDEIMLTVALYCFVAQWLVFGTVACAFWIGVPE